MSPTTFLALTLMLEPSSVIICAQGKVANPPYPWSAPAGIEETSQEKVQRFLDESVNSRWEGATAVWSLGGGVGITISAYKASQYSDIDNLFVHARTRMGFNKNKNNAYNDPNKPELSGVDGAFEMKFRAGQLGYDKKIKKYYYARVDTTLPFEGKDCFDDGKYVRCIRNVDAGKFTLLVCNDSNTVPPSANCSSNAYPLSKVSWGGATEGLQPVVYASFLKGKACSLNTLNSCGKGEYEYEVKFALKGSSERPLAGLVDVYAQFLEYKDGNGDFRFKLFSDDYPYANNDCGSFSRTVRVIPTTKVLSSQSDDNETFSQTVEAGLQLKYEGDATGIDPLPPFSYEMFTPDLQVSDGVLVPNTNSPRLWRSGASGELKLEDLKAKSALVTPSPKIDNVRSGRTASPSCEQYGSKYGACIGVIVVPVFQKTGSFYNGPIVIKNSNALVCKSPPASEVNAPPAPNVPPKKWESQIAQTVSFCPLQPN